MAIRAKPPTEIADVLKRKGVPLWSYISHDDVNIYTSKATITDWTTSSPRFADITVRKTIGNNATGHKLPASST